MDDAAPDRRTSPRSRRSSRAVVVAAVAILGLASLAIAVLLATRGSGSPGCQDARRPGLDPALEARVPHAFEGRPPDRLDSALTCSAEGLGSLASAGVASVSSAGGLWELGPSTGITLVVFRLDRPDRAERIADFYASGAASAPKVAGLTTSHPTLGPRGAPATRLDYTDADFPQSIVVWPAPDADLVYVVLAAGVPDRVVEEGIAAFEPGG